MLVYETLSSDSFLEYAFLRWVLAPAVHSSICQYVVPQQPVFVGKHTFKVDYAVLGSTHQFAVELDGFEFHGNRLAFSYDRMRQNDLQAAGWHIIRFSYDSIRNETARCVAQFQTLLARDARLAAFLISDPRVEIPDMKPEALYGLGPSPHRASASSLSYFDTIRHRLSLKTLRECQLQAFSALANYYQGGGRNAACVMSVGAGKTGLGVTACLGLARRRALIVTPGSVIRGAFDRALNPDTVGNTLYGLPDGPLIPGCKPPRVMTLDRANGPIRRITREELLGADVIVTNFHSLYTEGETDGLLTKLGVDDIDFIVVDEAHIAASASYQAAFRHFHSARTLLMSACFQRLDGKPIDADVVYSYRLIDAIADGHAKNLRVRRFAPEAEQTTYEMSWPDGRSEAIIGRQALLNVIQDERRLAGITAKSDASIRQVMRAVKQALDQQAQVLYPIKPRVLFSALGERHASQITRIAQECGIACAFLHHSMTETRITAIRERYEQESGDLQGIVQIKMLGQGYDFPPVTVVAPMRPYGSFGEFYQFIGRGIRVLQHPQLKGRITPADQFLDIIYHAEMGLDDHIDTILRENDMGPQTIEPLTEEGEIHDVEVRTSEGEVIARPETFVLFEPGKIVQRIVHDEERVEQRRQEREREALAQRYSVYAQSSHSPVSFEQFVLVMRQLSDK